MPLNRPFREDRDFIGNIENALLMRDNDDGTGLNVLAHGLEDADEVLKAPQVDPASGSSKTVRREFLASTVAISMRLSSPPEREALTSR